MRAAEDRRVNRHNGGVVQAYICAALMRHPARKRLPKLDSLLAKPRKGPQSWQEQLAIAKMWTAALGGTVQKSRK